MFELLFTLLERMSMIVTLAFLMTRFNIVRQLIQRQANWRQKLTLTLVFGILGILGTYIGIPVEGALANSRVVAPLVGGLLGGPFVGLTAGLIAGTHRYLLGGFTALSCGISTTLEGLLGGIVGQRRKIGELSWQTAFWTGFFAEMGQMAIIMLISRPLQEAWELVRLIAVPMIVVNAAGIAIFILIIRNVFLEQERAGAVQAQKALRIADKTLPYLRQGLSFSSARNAAQIIFDMTDVQAVAITDHEQILAHVGLGADHHLPGQPVMTAATKNVLATGEPAIAKNQQEIICEQEGCPLQSAVIVPLKKRKQVVGALKIYQSKQNAIGQLEMELATGLGHLFSTQLELADLEIQSQLLAKAEIKALQAQINPHFLFNSLNTIMAFCRTSPEKARDLLASLANFFRMNLSHVDDYVSLERELEHIKSYLALEQARFGPKLQVEYRIPPEAKEWQLPALTLQPLVENAIKHGLLPKKNGGCVLIQAQVLGDELVVTVEDNGVGMEAAQVEQLFTTKGSSASGIGIGFSNVNQRFKSIYGPKSSLQVTSKPGVGTKVEVRIPKLREG